jgi:CheY-like chemotaxis protein
MTILIVEDDDEIRELLAEMLGEEGYAVVTASDGREALTRLEAGLAPRLVVLDLMMPNMDGWSLRAAMLEDPTLARIPVVVLSGAADVRQASSGLGAVKVLTKPVKWTTFLEVVREHL